MLDTLGKTDSITAVSLRTKLQAARLIEAGQTPTKEAPQPSCDDIWAARKALLEDRPALAGAELCWRCAQLIGDAEYLVNDQAMVSHRDCPKKEVG